ncbi:MAG: T9SS type A sorting domain-containing protein [Flavobacteriales bacterium]|nr:T9SS type A sorting domain-containing protein [Flavobacteriales bacterium]
MKTPLLFLLSLVSTFVVAQSKIDTTFNFQSDPAKKLSIYVPTAYVSGTNNALMLALHPWNTARWNAKSWRDTLISFAENNWLILLCPDGGSDGKVDDAIDLAFTTAMLDSISNWYSIDKKRTFCMGFSWGGKATYTYGLANPKRFCGYIPIGAAIDVREVALVSDSAKDKPIYIIHGDQDAVATRYTPLKNVMDNKGGIVNSLLMAGVGHTIDFPKRNQILSTAFNWVDSVCVNFTPTIPVDTTANPNSINESKGGIDINLFPNPAEAGELITLKGWAFINLELSVYDLGGNHISTQTVNEKGEFEAPHKSGAYIVYGKFKEGLISKNLIVK